MEQSVAYILPEGMELVVFVNSPIGADNDRIDTSARHQRRRRAVCDHVEGDAVRLSANADVAAALFEQEESGAPIG